MNYSYGWYPVVTNIIGRYPELYARQEAALRRLSPRAAYRAQAQDARPLSPAEQREFDAVSGAMETILRWESGAEALAVVELVDWQRTHNLWGAALKLGFGRTRTQDLRARFVYLTAVRLGYPARPQDRWRDMPGVPAEPVPALAAPPDM